MSKIILSKSAWRSYILFAYTRFLSADGPRKKCEIGINVDLEKCEKLKKQDDGCQNYDKKDLSNDNEKHTEVRTVLVVFAFLHCSHIIAVECLHWFVIRGGALCHYHFVVLVIDNRYDEILVSWLSFFILYVAMSENTEFNRPRRKTKAIVLCIHKSTNFSHKVLNKHVLLLKQLRIFFVNWGC